MKPIRIACAVMPFLCFAASFAAAGGPGKTSLGFRAGWSGAPNGITLRYRFAPHQAVEVVTGYNNKEGRRMDLSLAEQGNYFLGIAYQPEFIARESDLGVGFFANLGLRARYHAYRSTGTEGRSVITPDLYTGVGMQLEFGDAMELFADINVKYYNKTNNAYVPGLESGAGIRFMIR